MSEWGFIVCLLLQDLVQSCCQYKVKLVRPYTLYSLHDLKHSQSFFFCTCPKLPPCTGSGSCIGGEGCHGRVEGARRARRAREHGRSTSHTTRPLGTDRPSPGSAGPVRDNVRNIPTRKCVCAVCTSAAHCSLYVCSSVLPEMKKWLTGGRAKPDNRGESSTALESCSVTRDVGDTMMMMSFICSCRNKK